MKTILLLAGACLAPGLTAAAQTDGPIRVKAGEEVSKAIPAGQRYRYEGFQPESIKYLSGTVSNGRLNYNLLLGEMQFIDPEGDTLSLAGETTLDHVRVGMTCFITTPRMLTSKSLRTSTP